MKRIFIGLLVIATVIGLWQTFARAGNPPHYTDGTSYDGKYNFGPPPLPAKWAGEPCKSDLLFDPPTYVFVTLHATADGSLATQFGSEVVPYVRTPPAWVDAPASFVDGTKGVIVLTWNIGTGFSKGLAYDCTTPPSSTTTVPSQTTTSVETGTPASTVPSQTPVAQPAATPVVAQPRTTG